MATSLELDLLDADAAAVPTPGRRRGLMLRRRRHHPEARLGGRSATTKGGSVGNIGRRGPGSPTVVEALGSTVGTLMARRGRRRRGGAPA